MGFDNNCMSHYFNYWRKRVMDNKSVLSECESKSSWRSFREPTRWVDTVLLNHAKVFPICLPEMSHGRGETKTRESRNEIDELPSFGPGMDLPSRARGRVLCWGAAIFEGPMRWRPETSRRGRRCHGDVCISTLQYRIGIGHRASHWPTTPTPTRRDATPLFRHNDTCSRAG